jgi:hypothetical protein
MAPGHARRHPLRITRIQVVSKVKIRQVKFAGQTVCGTNDRAKPVAKILTNSSKNIEMTNVLDARMPRRWAFAGNMLCSIQVVSLTGLHSARPGVGRLLVRRTIDRA